MSEYYQPCECTLKELLLAVSSWLKECSKEELHAKHKTKGSNARWMSAVKSENTRPRGSDFIGRKTQVNNIN